MLKNLTIAAVLAAAAFAVSPALACDGEDHAAAPKTAQAAKPEINNLTVDQLASKLEESKKTKASIAIFDANSKETRETQGIIPTAVLLSSSKDFDLAVLPKDKAADVVFYCAAEKCGASKTAAKKALEAGYSKVHVLPAGIAGWVKAGKPVEKVAAQAAEKAPEAAKPLQG